MCIRDSGCPACGADWKSIDVGHGPGCPKNLLEEAMDTPNGGLVRRCFRILSAKNIGLKMCIRDRAYEAYPRTFQPFCRQVTAPDFKPINRVQLSDAPALQQLNEKGEYHRANLTDMNTNYSLQTFGEVVAITRKVIILSLIHI